MSRFSRWLRARPAFQHPREPSQHLLYVPRYAPRQELLLGQPFVIADGPSFYFSYREIFEHEIYRFHAETAEPRIIDCGANCGQSVVYLRSLYPGARITAIEADPKIFAILKQNMASRGWTDVDLIHGAVSAERGTVTFHHEGADSGRIHQLSESHQSFEVPAIPLDDLLSGQVDFLKIDIEGAETEALCASQRLHLVRQLFVEHHSFADAAQSLHRVLAKLQDHGFRYYLQTQFCAERPFVERTEHLGMDLQMNVFATRLEARAAA
jgi:FkbM family methyltransferase